MSDPCTPYERAALLTWLFCQGGTFTALQVACRLNLSISQAQRLLITLARVIPIYRDCGKWQLLTDKTA